MDTWIFLGVLAAVSIGSVAFYGWAISAYREPAPRDDIEAIAVFLADRMEENEFDLGRNWRSTDDPDAMWHLWWVPETGELVGLRMGAVPAPPSLRYTTRLPSALRSGLANIPYSGMKVLGHLDHRPSLGLCNQLRELPHGLDVLCGGTHGEDGDDLTT